MKASIFALCLLLTGCHPSSTSSTSPPASPPEAARAANTLFLGQKPFDPWLLINTDPNQTLYAYIADGRSSALYDSQGTVRQRFQAGQYRNDVLTPTVTSSQASGTRTGDGGAYRQTLNMRTGAWSAKTGEEETSSGAKWPHLWERSDIVIDGDPEAQQVTHANLFYLLSSTYPGSSWSIPPMGLSSNAYGGHIFWDAEIWMLPALIVQHPEYAKPILDYRFRRLAQAKRNARAHGYAGAEYPWESAETGAEVAPAEFARERHITADIAFAAWQYYLWTGDKEFLLHEGWPLLQASAQYWASRVTKGPDTRWHIKGVVSPDESAGVVDDDAYTNAVVGESLRDATRAARLLGRPADPSWGPVAIGLFMPFDKARAIPAENAKPMTDHFAAKQADTLLLLHPLHGRYDASTQQRMLTFYAAHTITHGPAMTSSIEAVVAARLGLAQPALDYFRDSYRPFERGPWDAFSEKRTTDNVYFLTGMAGCLQSVLYGFAGLGVYGADEKPVGRRLAGDQVAALYADPHLPPGWGPLRIKGVRFRGRVLDVTVLPGNTVDARPAGAAP